MVELEKINFNNFTEPGLSKEILMQLQNNIENAINNAVHGEVLFESTTGTTGDVNLQTDPNQYERLKIYYGKGEAGTSCVEIPKELFSSTINFTQAQDAGGTFQMLEKKYIIDGTYLRVTGTPGFVNFANGGITEQSKENMINIYKVVGYK